jgi:hypothetical protein
LIRGQLVIVCEDFFQALHRGGGLGGKMRERKIRIETGVIFLSHIYCLRTCLFQIFGFDENSRNWLKSLDWMAIKMREW